MSTLNWKYRLRLKVDSRNIIYKIIKMMKGSKQADEKEHERKLWSSLCCFCTHINGGGGFSFVQNHQKNKLSCLNSDH